MSLTGGSNSAIPPSVYVDAYAIIYADGAGFVRVTVRNGWADLSVDEAETLAEHLRKAIDVTKR